MSNVIAFFLGITWGLVILALIKYLRIKPVNIYIGRDIPIECETKPKIHKDKPIPETEEERRQRILNENVENYIGNGKNQVKL